MDTPGRKRRAADFRAVCGALLLAPACAPLYATRTESVISARPFEREVQASPRDRIIATTDGRVATVRVERVSICGMQKAEQRIIAIRRDESVPASVVRGEAIAAGGLGAVGVVGGVAVAEGHASTVAILGTSLLVPAAALGVIAVVDANRGDSRIGVRLENVPVAFAPRECATHPVVAMDVVLACNSGIHLKAITDAKGVATIPLGPVPPRGLDCSLSAPGTRAPPVHVHAAPAEGADERGPERGQDR